MRPDLFQSILPFDEALRRVIAGAHPISRIERVALGDAAGRVSASDVLAAMDVPPFDRAAMDGYALRSEDVGAAHTNAPVTLTCLDQIFTGYISPHTITAGTCAEIGTGAPMPTGADAVVMVERTSRTGALVAIREATRAGQNVGRRGADIAAGQPAVRAGDYIGPARAGALAAIGASSLDVFARPSVAILSTGHEVILPGHALPAGHIYDVNGTTIAAIVREHGGVPVPLETVDDSIETLTASLVHAATCDVVVTSGGSSVGGRDLLLDALQRCGTVVFHGIAVKPGKPTLFGHVGNTPIFGMPGNPTSCLSNAYILLIPFLRTMARLPEWQPVRQTLPLGRAVPALADRHQFYTVRIVDGVAEPAFKSSGDITSMAAADGYIEVPAGEVGYAAGDLVTVVRI